MIRKLLTNLVHKLVKEELARIQSSPNRYVACPNCGKSYHLINDCKIAHYVRQATVSCSQCGQHFEVRPGMFWEKIEVEKR